MAMPEMVTSMCISAGTKWMKIHGGKKSRRPLNGCTESRKNMEGLYLVSMELALQREST